MAIHNREFYEDAIAQKAMADSEWAAVERFCPIPKRGATPNWRHVLDCCLMLFYFRGMRWKHLDAKIRMAYWRLIEVGAFDAIRAALPTLDIAPNRKVFWEGLCHGAQKAHAGRRNTR